MDTLRISILRILDRLSETHRQNLHFVFANYVPRIISDDLSPKGTLKLIETLFERGFVSEQNPTMLVNAFHSIQFHEGMKILEDLENASYSSIEQLCRPKPLNVQVVDDQEEEDKSAGKCLLTQTNFYTEQKTTVNPMAIKIDKKQYIASFSRKTERFHNTWKLNRYLFCIILFLFLALTIVLTILLKNLYGTNCLINNTKFSNIESKSDGNIEEKIQLIQRNKTPEYERDHLPIKPGQIFGKNTNGSFFDDSRYPEFTFSHYFYGLIVRADTNGLETYQFDYKSPYPTVYEIQSETHGNDSFRQFSQHKFSQPNERIERVEGTLVNRTIRIDNGVNVTKSFITSLRFLSNENDKNPYQHSTGVEFSESFPGYYLGYVTGRSGQYIEQLQFFWYRSGVISEEIYRR